MDTNDMIISKGNIKAVASALASQTRLDIINMLSKKNMNVTEISSAMNIPVSSAISAVRKLEEAGLVRTDIDGRKKVCSIPYKTLILELNGKKTFQKERKNAITYNIPIGDYCEYHAVPSCGLVGNRNFIGELDNEECFASPDRIDACLIWLRKGFLKYRVVKPMVQRRNIQSVSISLEICSEFPGYNNNFVSNIDYYVNGKFVGTWVAQGDYGGRYGIFTPRWWSLSNTQFGNLVTCCITKEGTFLNTEKVSDVNIDSVEVNEREDFDVKIETQGTGGFNIFGRNFGDYDQDIIIRFNLSTDLDDVENSFEENDDDEDVKKHFIS